MQVTKGLSIQRLQDVERFDAHAALVETLLLLKDMVANPKLLNDLAIRKAEALRLTQDEEKKRQEALELISRTDELKHSFVALDDRERKIDQQHKDNLNAVDLMKAEAKQGFDAREKSVREAEQVLAEKKASDEKDFQKRQAKLKSLETEHQKKINDLAARNEDLKKWEGEIAERLNSVVDREKALFRRN